MNAYGVNSFDSITKPTNVHTLLITYKDPVHRELVNLPGIGDTVINQAVPPGGDLCIALGQVEACDLPKRGRLGCAIFGSGGQRTRFP